MMGLEAHKYGSSLQCVRELVRAGGVRSLFFGVVPRAVRVFIEERRKSMHTRIKEIQAHTPSQECKRIDSPASFRVRYQVGLQFTLFEQIGRVVDRTLRPRVR